MSTRAWVQNVPDYPGIYTLQIEAGDVATRVVLTQPEIELLRASAGDAMATSAQLRNKLRQHT